ELDPHAAPDLLVAWGRVQVPPRTHAASGDHEAWLVSFGLRHRRDPVDEVDRPPDVGGTVGLHQLLVTVGVLDPPALEVGQQGGGPVARHRGRAALTGHAVTFGERSLIHALQSYRRPLPCRGEAYIRQI